MADTGTNLQQETPLRFFPMPGDPRSVYLPLPGHPRRESNL